ncbi:methanogenesis marker 6 protein [Methanoculleus sp.]|uniref:methanogenesis marker 6 protein n=1 Tax=Methanoculleus sp. TaxID=90427 RepID=UPI0025F8AFE7|nr:methanogenesis marker 6 protein [Methanoculleus sp.]
MGEYRPDYVDTVTKYVFIESPSMTPGELALRAYEASEGVLIKETCFGLQVSGEPESVDRLIEEIRTFDPVHIFVKDRGFPPGDPRRCRANLGGARPGYLGHEREFRVLRYITRGLEELDRREEGAEVPEPAPPAREARQKLDIKRLQELIDTEES